MCTPAAAERLQPGGPRRERSEREKEEQNVFLICLSIYQGNLLSFADRAGQRHVKYRPRKEK